jgi:hypothetical protein
MLMDKTGLFSDGQAITSTGATASTNVIDLGPFGTPYGSPSALAREIGPSQTELSVTATETFNNLTSMTIAVQTATDAAFTTPTTVVTYGPYTLAQLATGARYLLPDEIPHGTNQRFVRLLYTVTGTAPTTGRISAGVVASRQKNRRY